MKVKLICAKLTTKHVVVKGVVDRRFKTGYRVLPQDWLGYNLSFTLENPDCRFNVTDYIVTEYGKFVVVSCDDSSQTMQLQQCRVIEPGDTFVFPSVIEILFAGRPFMGEGSIAPKINPLNAK